MIRPEPTRPQAERDQLASALFPAEWAAASCMSGKSGCKRRHNLRRRAEIAQKLAALRQAGAACANCESFSGAPFGFKVGTMVCDMGSGGGAYQIAQAAGLCALWSARS